jgi:hypothetical protein
MEHDKVLKALDTCLEKYEYNFILLSKLKDNLPSDVVTLLGLKRKISNKDIKKIIESYKVNHLEIVEKKRGKNPSSYYLTRYSDEKEQSQIIYNYIRNNLNMSVKKICQNQPFKKSIYYRALNYLIQVNKIKINFRDDMESPFFLIEEDTAPILINTEPKDAIIEFHQAYRELVKGRSHVKIFEIRRILNWSETKFNETLEKLRDKAVIQLIPGDTNKMEKSELKDSFLEDNIRYIALFWR